MLISTLWVKLPFMIDGACMRPQSVQTCPTLCDPVEYSPPGFFVHEILQARILEWVAIPSSRDSSRPKDQTHVSCITGRFFSHWATWEAHHYDGRFSVFEFLLFLLYMCCHHIRHIYMNILLLRWNFFYHFLEWCYHSKEMIFFSMVFITSALI